MICIREVTRVIGGRLSLAASADRSARSAGARLPCRIRPFPIGGSHCQFPDVLVRMKYDNVHFGDVETDQGDRGA